MLSQMLLALAFGVLLVGFAPQRAHTAAPVVADAPPGDGAVCGCGLGQGRPDIPGVEDVAAGGVDALSHGYATVATVFAVPPHSHVGVGASATYDHTGNLVGMATLAVLLVALAFLERHKSWQVHDEDETSPIVVRPDYFAYPTSAYNIMAPAVFPHYA